MAASGAGLNRVGQYGGIPFFNYTGFPAGLSSPLTGAGPFDSGIQMLEAIGFTKWSFQLLGTFTNYSVSIYGTIDPLIFYTLDNNPNDNMGTLRGNTTLLPSTSWFLLPAPSEQGGTGTVSNPLIAAGSVLTASMPLVAVRAVVTGSSQTGSIQVVGFAVP